MEIVKRLPVVVQGIRYALFFALANEKVSSEPVLPPAIKLILKPWSRSKPTVAIEMPQKTYPVQLQLGSVVFEGKSTPCRAALVEGMLMAEFGTCS